MSHHSDEPPANDELRKLFADTKRMSIEERMEQTKRELLLGATGEFPDGTIDRNDQGAIRIGIAADPATGKVLINFGTPVVWFGMTKQQALDLAESLTLRARELK